MTCDTGTMCERLYDYLLSSNPRKHQHMFVGWPRTRCTLTGVSVGVAIRGASALPNDDLRVRGLFISGNPLPRKHQHIFVGWPGTRCTLAGISVGVAIRGTSALPNGNLRVPGLAVSSRSGLLRGFSQILAVDVICASFFGGTLHQFPEGKLYARMICALFSCRTLHRFLDPDGGI